MDRFQEIKDLYGTLLKSEKELLHINLRALAEASYKGYAEIDALYQAVQFAPEATKEDVFSRVFGNNTSETERAQSLLEARDFLLENLQNSQNVSRPGIFSNAFKVRSLNAKRIGQAIVLHRRGATEAAIKLLDEVVSRSKKYELSIQEIEALRLARIFNSAEKGLRTFNRYSRLIEEAKERDYILDFAQKLFTQHQFILHGNETSRAMESLEKELKDLNKLNKKYTLQHPEYITSMIRIAGHKVKNEYREAIGEIEKLLQFISEAPAVQTKNRVRQLMLSRAELLIYTGRFDEASIQIEEVRPLVKKSGYENYLCDKWSVLCALYLNRLDDATEQLEKLLSSKFTLRLAYAVAQFQCYFAYLKFARGDVKGSLILAEGLFLQPEQLDIEVRISCAILILLTSLRVDGAEVSACINEAKSFLEQHEREGTLPKRLQVMLEIASLAISNNAKARSRYTATRKQLQSASGSLAWTPLTAEVLPLHEKLDLWVGYNKSRRGRPRKKV